MRPGPPRYYNLAIVEPGTPFPPPRNGYPAFLLPLFAPVPVAAVVARCNLARLQPKAALCIGPNAPGCTGRIWGRHPESRGSQNGRGPRRQNYRFWDSWGPVAIDAYTLEGLAYRRPFPASPARRRAILGPHRSNLPAGVSFSRCPGPCALLCPTECGAGVVPVWSGGRTELRIHGVLGSPHTVVCIAPVLLLLT